MSGRIEVAGVTIDLDPVEHALLGRAHRILRGDQLLTHVSAIDWDAPAEIPAIAAPGALPAGSGGAIMNLLAERARDAGIRALRYAGPYPTPALYRTLLRSFRSSADEATFTRDLVERMSTLARTPIAVDFAPAPHHRVEHAHGVSEVRDGLERTTIDGIAYDRDGSPARLVEHVAEVWFGDAPYACMARFSLDGHLLDGPHPIPPITSSALGKPFPSSLAAALGDLVADLVPEPLAPAARQILAERPILWADLGARAARATPDHFEVHAALWERIAPQGMARVAVALAEALAPVVTTTLSALLLRTTLP